jgi:hypothetical protein
MRGRLLFRLFLGAALLGCLLNGWSPRPARAATVVTIDGKPFNYAEDRLLVYFDPVGKRETVIFSPAIRYRDDRFAWILPVTGDVKLSPASPQFFQRLDDYLTPTVIQEKAKIRAGSLLWSWLRPEPVLPPADPLAPGPGQIVVARRTATARGDIVVKATEKDLETALQPTLVLPPSEKPYNPKMREAAKQETAPLPKGFREWAAPFIKKNVSWVVATARTDVIERETGYDEQVAIPPFAVTFTTDAPVIPLVAPPPENPPDKAPKHRNFRVYVVTKERSDVFRDGKPMFPNEAVTFADRVTLNDWKQKILAPTTPELTIAGDAFLTAFSFTERDQTAFTDNPEIRTSASQTTLRPPVRVIIKEKPAIVPVEALLFILGGVILYFKQRRKE